MANAGDLYLDLMKRMLTRSGFEDNHVITPGGSGWKHRIADPALQFLARRDFQLVRNVTTDASLREEGRDWPLSAETMIGLRRLDNLQHCIETVIADDVPGDLIETGVWRGGAAILMRAVLAAHDVTNRTVWVADSFRGLPDPDVARYPADEGDRHSTFKELAVSADEVRANFAKYHLLDDQVRFLEGWFADTLPTAPIDQLSVARLDGDMYGSTWDAITALYPKLSPGGFLIVDDYGCAPGCAKAIEDYRVENEITEPIEEIDWTGAFWRKRR